MTSMQPTIGIIVGSNRDGSFNHRLAEHVRTLSPYPLVDLIGIGTLPYFGEDIEEPTPTTVAELREAVSEVDGVLLVTPEYNAGMPGVLKNAIDWLSRPFGESAIAGKPVAVIGASPSPGGAVGAVTEAIRVLDRAKARPLAETVTVPRAHEALAGDLDDDLAGQLHGVLNALAAAQAA